MLVLATYEQNGDPLPFDWLQKTGTSQEALKYLHPNVRVSSRFRNQQRINEQQMDYTDEKIPNVRHVDHGSVSADLAIPNRRESS